MGKRMISLWMAALMVCTMLVVPAAAEDVEYSFNLNDIPQKDWDNSRVEILLHVTTGFNSSTTKDILIPANKEGYGHASLMGLPVYENGVKTKRSMSITVVPVRLLSEQLNIPISWDQATQSVIIDSYRGKVTIPLGASEINLPDGTTFQETQYTYPDGSPIQLALNRAQESRVYLPIRAFSSIAFVSSRWDWSNAGRLEGWVTLDDGKMNTNKDWVGVWNPETPFMEDMVNLPHIAAAIEETNASTTKRGNSNYMTVRPADAETTEYIFLSKVDGGIRIAGLQNYVGHRYESENPGYLKIIKGILDDFISDPEDVAAIYNMVEDVEKNGTPITEIRTFNTVIIDWRDTENGQVGDMRIYNK